MTQQKESRQVAAHAEMLVPIFLAAESAATKGPVEMEMSSGYDAYGTHQVLLQQDDALRRHGRCVIWHPADRQCISSCNWNHLISLVSFVLESNLV